MQDRQEQLAQIYHDLRVYLCLLYTSMSDCRWPAAVYFMKNVPREYMGVRIYRGVEADIIDYEGKISVEERYYPLLDFMIASLHDVVMQAGSKAQNTQAMIGALNHPQVDILGHPGTPFFEVDIEAVVRDCLLYTSRCV